MMFPFGKNILITGASSGIGLSCAGLFSRNGFEVWGVSRRGVPPAPMEHVHMYGLDITEEAKVQTVLEQINGEALRLTGENLSIVLDCAGMGIAGAAEDTPTSEVRKQFEVNYFGTLTVNRAALPYLRKNKHSLVLVIGSVAGRISIPYQSHYSSSKYALEAYVEALRLESGKYGVSSCIIEPGDTHTPFTQNRILSMDKQSIYYETACRSVEKMAKDELQGKKPDSVAKVAFGIATHRRVPIRKAVGASYKLLLLLKRILPSALVEQILKKMYRCR